MTPTHKPEDGDRAPISNAGSESELYCRVREEFGHFARAGQHACLDSAMLNVDALLAEKAQRIERLEEALRQADSVLRVIEEQNPIENCLDPQWAARIAKSARAALSQPHPHGG